MRSRIAWAIFVLVVVLIGIALMRFNLTALHEPGRVETRLANLPTLAALTRTRSCPAAGSVQNLQPTEATFWFMMQIGMIVAFFTSNPAKIFLLKTGWKEKMPLSQQETIFENLDEPSGRGHAA